MNKGLLAILVFVLVLAVPTAARAEVSIGVFASDGHGWRHRHHDRSHYRPFRHHSYYRDFHSGVSFGYGHGRHFSSGVTYYYPQTEYVVVQQPQAVYAPPPEPLVVSPTSYSKDSYIVNVPKGNGVSTQVTIRRYNDGYSGPQGEFYDEFPTVEQLKARY